MSSKSIVRSNRVVASVKHVAKQEDCEPMVISLPDRGRDLVVRGNRAVRLSVMPVESVYGRRYGYRGEFAKAG